MTARWWVPQVPRSQTYTPTRNREELATIENGGLRRLIEQPLRRLFDQLAAGDPLQLFGAAGLFVEPVDGYGDVPRNCHTRGMDQVRIHLARLKPARQPEAVTTSFKG